MDEMTPEEYIAFLQDENDTLKLELGVQNEYIDKLISERDQLKRENAESKDELEAACANIIMLEGRLASADETLAILTDQDTTTQLIASQKEIIDQLEGRLSRHAREMKRDQYLSTLDSIDMRCEFALDSLLQIHGHNLSCGLYLAALDDLRSARNDLAYLLGREEP